MKRAAVIVVFISVALVASLQPGAKRDTIAGGFPFSSSPAYDSGYLELDLNPFAVTHDIGGDPDKYLVYMECLLVQSRTNRGVGFDWAPDYRLGVHWSSLDADGINIHPGHEAPCTKTRVRIWTNTNPAYDSGFVSLATGQLLALNHGVGGNTNHYLVDMECKSPLLGRHNQSVGGDIKVDTQEREVGAFWRSLGTQQISVQRLDDDTVCPEVRIRIFLDSAPDYDTGTVDTSSGFVGFHGINTDPEAFVVNLECYSNFIGRTNRGVGGDAGDSFDFGAYWTGLSGLSIVVQTLNPSFDLTCGQVRLRIWDSAAPAPTPTPTPMGTPSPTTTTATPTPSPTVTAVPTPVHFTSTPPPSGAPSQLTQGDNDCDGDSDAVDALVSLQESAGFQPNQHPGCPELGSALPAGGDQHFFGDIDCDGDVDAVDALQILRNVAGLPVSQFEPCPGIGEPL